VIVYVAAVLAALVTLLLTATPLESDPAFRAAQARYDDFEFADARERFEKLLQRKLDDKTRARVLVWVGMCDAEDGALSDAAAAFDEAAAYDLEVKPLPTMSPKARRMLDEARTRARKRMAGVVDDAPAEPPPTSSPTVTAGPGAGPMGAAASPLVLAGGVGVGTAVVAALGGAVAGGLASAAADEAASVDDAALSTKRYADASNLALAANVAFGAATVAGVVGVVVLAIGVAGHDSAAP
jgi:hypothetical protein